MKRELGKRIKIKDIPKEERPRERMFRVGPHSLSNMELVAAILGTGTKKEDVLEVAKRLLSEYALEDFPQITSHELKKILGINDAKACQLLAAIELGKRFASHSTAKKKSIENTGDVADIFMARMKGLKKETLNGLYLDSKLHVIKDEIISVGGLNTNSVEPAGVFRAAVSLASAAVILVHNHPSGDPNPSKMDVIVTKRLAKAGRVIGIELLDHIIIGDGTYTSLKEAGLF